MLVLTSLTLPTFTTLTISTVLLSLTLLAVRRRYFHPLSIYPGPFLASITDLWRFKSSFLANPPQHHLIDYHLHQHYGPIVRIGPNTLSFSSAEAAGAMYGQNKAMAKGVFYSCFGEREPEKANMFQSRERERHHEIRKKFVWGALVPSRTKDYEPIATKTVQIFITELQKSLATSSENVVNMAPRVHLFAMDTFFEISHGTSLNLQILGYEGHGGAAAEQRDLTKSGFRISLLPWLATVLQPISYVQMVHKATFDRDGKARGFYAIIDRSKRAQADAIKNENGFVEDMEPCILKNLVEVDPADERRMEQMEMWRELFNASMAGTGSISACLTMILFHLGAHPEWQTRIVEEVSSSLPPLSASTNSPISSSLLTTLSYNTLFASPSLSATIKESLRLTPPFPAAFPRDIAPGAENAIPGLTKPLPVGTTVQANVYVVAREKGFWGEDAEEWRPERWMGGGENVGEGEMRGEEKGGKGLEGMAGGKRGRLEDGWLVFGRGHRACVGRGISWMAMCEIVWAILAKYEIRAKPETLAGKNYFEMQYERLDVEFRPRWVERA